MKILRLFVPSIFLLMMVSGLLSNSAQADIVVYDHFDNGQLDSSWLISYSNATGWSYVESGTTLNVTDISPAISQGWTCVNLSRYITPLSDFSIDFNFSWDSEGSVNAIQNVLVQMYDDFGNKISEVGYSGSKYGMIGGETVYYNTLPLSGSASVNILRSGDNINVLWDGATLISGTWSAPLSRVDLVFSYYKDSGGTSFFGNESVDLLKVEDTPVTPEPKSFILFTK